MRHGFLLVDKPRGPTSHDIVSQVRRILGERHIGHLGTLDPLATGLMVLAVGSKALKVVELFKGLGKEYEAEVTLGAVSTTYDAEGAIEIVPLKAGWLPPDDASRIQALIDDRFLGKVSQVPPAFSAVHVGGTRAYRKAQRGESLEMKAREVNILHCKVVNYAYPKMTLTVRCDAGTYIRSLAHDLGESMRCGGYLSALRRTMVGEWSVGEAVKPEEVKWTDIMPLKDILRPFEGVIVTPNQWEHLSNGRSVAGTCSVSVPHIAWLNDLPMALLEPDKKREGMVKPRKVL